MTLEQRVDALEKAVAKLTLPSTTAEELAKVIRDVAKETIKNARRPGGMMHHSDEKAVKEKTAGNIQLSEKDILVKLESGITSCRLSLT